MKRDEVLSALKQNNILAEQFGIKSLYLFGSTARDEARPDSDVDLLVEFNRPLGLFEFIELQQKLESILGCKVDLGTKRSLKQQIKEEVLQGAILVT
ncbi:MAG: nucleotidyltransferase family protein [Anaerolineaceae bacterium]|nr:nucleotidyltransferase family protein [Anaerolineaceae bacterium]